MQIKRKPSCKPNRPGRKPKLGAAGDLHGSRRSRQPAPLCPSYSPIPSLSDPKRCHAAAVCSRTLCYPARSRACYFEGRPGGRDQRLAPWCALAGLLARNQIHEGHHVRPVRHRARRPARRRAALAAGLRRAAQAGRPASWPRRSRGRRSRRRRWSTKRICGWWVPTRLSSLEQPRPLLCRRGRGHAAHSDRPGPRQAEAEARAADRQRVDLDGVDVCRRGVGGRPARPRRSPASAWNSRTGQAPNWSSCVSLPV